jgi:hypothetical protein
MIPMGGEGGVISEGVPKGRGGNWQIRIYLLRTHHPNPCLRHLLLVLNRGGEFKTVIFHKFVSHPMPASATK